MSPSTVTLLVCAVENYPLFSYKSPERISGAFRNPLNIYDEAFCKKIVNGF